MFCVAQPKGKQC